MQHTVGILVFPEVEILDFCGPFEVFSATRLNEERRREEPSPLHVVLIAEGEDPVSTTGGMHVLPDFTLENHPTLDILVVPGGWGTRALQSNKRVLGWVALCAQQAKVVCSVCTGSFLLAGAGLLEGRSATTHWQSLHRMRETFPNVNVRDDLHVVNDGNIFTSAGVSAGIDMALHLVALMYGAEIGRATARHMEYPVPESNARRVEAQYIAAVR
ncbi:MAG TPA: DJ-1/PfpI family protein [Terriglobales bacterium]|nr:DJ-1/PfpI family protein [Terriglobales bacterium]